MTSIGATGPVTPESSTSGSLKEGEIAREQRYVDGVYARLEEMRAQARLFLREAFAESQAGTAAALVDRDVAVHRAARRVSELDAADDGLVFGRLDLTTGEVRYVGRLGVRTAERESLVIDWRAPAAEAFYQATSADPRDVVRRRVLHSRGHAVVDLEDDLLDAEAGADLPVLGDGAFVAALARTREGAMRDIVATIQREQDEVIRAPADGTVVVQGGPGTGKTAVALHRVAYLLFRHRRRFGSRGVLVVGPNPRFTAYIRRVLPSLGEESATLGSLGDLVAGVTAAYHDDHAIARLKGAATMARTLRRAITEEPPGAPQELRVTHRGTVVRLTGDALRALRKEVHRKRRREPNASAALARNLMLDALWRRLTELGVDDGPFPPERAAFDDDVRDQRAFTAFMAAWWPVRTPLGMLEELSDPARLRPAAGRSLGPAETEAVAASWRELREGRVSYADVALLDELDALLGRAPRVRRPVDEEDDDPYVIDGVNVLTGERVSGGMEYAELSTYADRMAGRRRGEDPVEAAPPEFGHVVVDEAQDLSPMQWRMLGRRGRHATWTVVADPAQSSWPDAEESAAAMEAVLGHRVRHDFELTTNYRNSAEIAAVAARVLAVAAPGVRPARAVRSGGAEPVIAEVPAEGLYDRAAAEAGSLARAVAGTVGVIVPPGRAAEVVRGADWPDRVQVLEALEAKGLEFDAAVIVAPEEIAVHPPVGQRTLYVALSRATQRLTVVTADPSLAGLLRD
ncbi:MAG: AAA family ATPase [Streptosporangiales bacterium]|nr:AAA family ATPase [Streptosporangiales bacterium]